MGFKIMVELIFRGKDQLVTQQDKERWRATQPGSLGSGFVGFNFIHNEVAGQVGGELRHIQPFRGGFLNEPGFKIIHGHGSPRIPFFTIKQGFVHLPVFTLQVGCFSGLGGQGGFIVDGG